MCETCGQKSDWKKNGHYICKQCDEIEEQSPEENYSHLIPNFDLVNDKIIIGNADFAMCKDLLKDAGITHILNCAKEQPCKFPQDFVYLKLNLDDWGDEDIMSLFEGTNKFIEESNKVYVHCMAGRSRSVSILIAYLMWKNKWNFREAYQFVKSKRSRACPNNGFIEQLEKYGELLMGKEACQKTSI